MFLLHTAFIYDCISPSLWSIIAFYWLLHHCHQYWAFANIWYMNFIHYIYMKLYMTGWILISNGWFSEVWILGMIQLRQEYDMADWTILKIHTFENCQFETRIHYGYNYAEFQNRVPVTSDFDEAQWWTRYEMGGHLQEGSDRGYMLLSCQVCRRLHWQKVVISRWPLTPNYKRTPSWQSCMQQAATVITAIMGTCHRSTGNLSYNHKDLSYNNVMRGRSENHNWIMSVF